MFGFILESRDCDCCVFLMWKRCEMSYENLMVNSHNRANHFSMDFLRLLLVQPALLLNLYKEVIL